MTPTPPDTAAANASCRPRRAAAGAAPPVNRYAVYFATGATMLAAYGWRRFRRA